MKIITPAEKSEWVCYLSGDPSRVEGSITVRPNKGNEPNWFHRKMQELMLGVKWVKSENK